MKKRLILAGALLVCFLGFIIYSIVHRRSESGSRNTSTYVKDPDTGEELFNDPNQDPEDGGADAEGPYLSLLGTQLLTEKGVTPNQVESLRRALWRYYTENAKKSAKDVVILKSTHIGANDTDGSLKLHVKFRPQNEEFDVEYYASDIGVSIFVGDVGPIYGDESIPDEAPPGD